jgi:plasmid maintenance system antidote protein VapI
MLTLEQIRYKLKERTTNHSDVSKITGLSRPTLLNICKNNTNINYNTFKKLSDYFEKK